MQIPKKPKNNYKNWNLRFNFKTQKLKTLTMQKIFLNKDEIYLFPLEVAIEDLDLWTL